MSEQQLQFWQKSWFMWLCLIFLTPIGIIICYINRERHPQWKAICGIFAVLLIIGVVLPKDDVNPKQNDKPVNTVENKQISKPKQTSNVYVTNDGKNMKAKIYIRNLYIQKILIMERHFLLFHLMYVFIVAKWIRYLNTQIAMA